MLNPDSIESVEEIVDLSCKITCALNCVDKIQNNSTIFVFSFILLLNFTLILFRIFDHLINSKFFVLFT